MLSRSSDETLANLLADPTSTQPAIIAESPDVVISYRALAEQVERLASELRGAGCQPGEVVALVLQNGPEFLALFLALVRARLIAAPVNPAFKTDELRGLLAELQPRAVLAAPGNEVVTQCAAEIGLSTWAAAVDSSGAVCLEGIHSVPSGLLAAPNAEDTAVLLHTSGTEAKPKLVPLTHRNVLLSARHIANHYALTPADRSLAVMPLFHGHGLIGVALATLVSGGAVILPPRFSASHFWDSFRRHGATWYSAVPTIHEILLMRADGDNAPRSSGRFIRSCSAALAPAVLHALEARFGAPVVEAYGMTESGHQAASNPIPPGIRKPGTVGVATGTEFAVIDSDGRHLPACSVGEIVVRGPCIMHGYRNNPAATTAAFIDGWLRTGDTGFLDEEGYLTLSGRTKEIINRGGEKVSPIEIDDVLLAHPAVEEAAAFAVPDPKYGEEVQAAVVLKGNATPEDLRAFCARFLADFKVPKVIHIVSALPKNSLGKVQRRSLGALCNPHLSLRRRNCEANDTWSNG